MSKLYSEIDIGPGFFMDMVHAGMDTIKTALHRLRRGRRTDGSAPFSARVVYAQPEFDVLTCRFPAGVNRDYRGLRFDPIGRCKAVWEGARGLPAGRQVAFEVVRLNRIASRDMMLAMMDREGLRPALYEELLGFFQEYPDELRKYPIAALGSEACLNGDQYVAFLWYDGSGRRLGLHWVGGDWHDRSRFLAVREPA